MRRALLLFLSALWLAGPVRAGSTWERIKASGQLRIVTDATYQPFEFVDNGEIKGFDRDLGDAIAKELGLVARWQSMEWAGVLPALLSGKADLVLSGVTITAERKQAYCFSRPYFLSGQVVVRRRGTGPSTLAETLGRDGTVAVQQETTGQTAAENAGIPKTRIHRFDTLQDALLDVQNGRSTVAVGDLPAVREMIRRDYPSLEISPAGVFVKENVGAVAAPESRTLMAHVNRAIGRILVNGTYDRIHAKWLGEPVGVSDIAALEAVRSDGSRVSELSTSGGNRAVATGEGEVSGASNSLAVRPELIPRILPVLLDGARLTLVLTVGSLVFGIPIGLLLALAGGQRHPLPSALSRFLVEGIRGTPLLLQIYVLYFVVPAVAPALGDNLGPMASGLMALSLNCGAYSSEIVRAGIDGVDTGQREAARALGMTDSQTMRHVVLPQAFRRVLAPLTNEAVALLKDSSLVSVVALSELTRVAKELVTRNGSPSTVYLLVSLLYLAMTLPLTALSRAWERRLDAGRSGR